MFIISLLINIIHLVIIAFILLGPYLIDYIIDDNKISRILYLIMYITFSGSLLIHWSFNNDICALTLLECYVSGKQMNETYMHRVISPFYKISEDNLQNLAYIILFINNVYVFNLLQKEVR